MGAALSAKSGQNDLNPGRLPILALHPELEFEFARKG